MELLVILLFFVLLALAAQRWGYDSRPGLEDRDRQAMLRPDDEPPHAPAPRSRRADHFVTLVRAADQHGPTAHAEELPRRR